MRLAASRRWHYFAKYLFDVILQYRIMERSLNAARTKGLDAGLELELHHGGYLILLQNSEGVHGGAGEAQTYLPVFADSREVDKRIDTVRFQDG